ncbi:24983_t:CDS:2 [Dentiscutata erythropus]|uniref:24983_t:CDS:1 n=1 Tax=Dentiscutata erythropus TaxID=1348616 RepID=A0A9N9I0M4_9GLOM|nr:24983_t:CDS:2 [Dentiscutata erythropus]
MGFMPNEQTKLATGSYIPAVVITNADLALDLAISEKYEKSYTIHCIFHTAQNLLRNLEAQLGQQYNEFVKDFYMARNSLIPNVFEHKWVQLTKKYNEPRVVKYLQILYSLKHAWVRVYMAKVFTASIQTMSRVKSYNAQIKRLVLNSNVSLMELADALETYINEESNKTKYIYWKTQIPLISSVIILPQALFSEVDKALSHFFTSAMLKVQRIKVKSCLNYQASSITKAELTRYQESESDTMQFVEDNEYVIQVSVNYVLKNIDVSKIEETWAIHTITASKFSRDITQRAVRFRQHDILKKLQDLLTELQEDVLVDSSDNDYGETCSNNNDDSDNIKDDKENDLLAGISFQNPKRRKVKGQPKSSKQLNDQKN